MKSMVLALQMKVTRYMRQLRSNMQPEGRQDEYCAPNIEVPSSPKDAMAALMQVAAHKRMFRNTHRAVLMQSENEAE